MLQQNYPIEGDGAGSAEPNTTEPLDREIDLTCPWCSGMAHDDLSECPVLNAPEEAEQDTTAGSRDDVAAQTTSLAQGEHQFDSNMFSEFTDCDDTQAPFNNFKPTQASEAPWVHGAESAQTTQEGEAAAHHSGHTRATAGLSAPPAIQETHENVSPDFAPSGHISTRADGEQLAPSLASSALNSLVKQGNDLNNAKTTSGEHYQPVPDQTAASVAGSSSNPEAEGILNFHPYTDTVPKGFAGPSAAKDWLEQIQAQLVKPVIKEDDYADFEDTDIMDKANEFYQAILQPPTGSLLKWEPYVKRYYVKNQQNSTTIINDMLANYLSHRKLFANCVMAAKELHKVHTHGVPQLHIDQAGKSSKCRKADGYSTDLELTCSQRFTEAIEKVRWNKSIAKRLAEGEYLYLVRDPKACHKRELNNVESNALKALNKANAEKNKGGQANTGSIVEGDENEESASDKQESLTAASDKAMEAGAEDDGKKRRGPSKKSAKSIASQNVTTQPTAPAMQAAAPILPAPTSSSVAGTAQQSAKRKRTEDDSGEDAIVCAQRRAQLGRLNYELKRHREEEAARARAAAPAGLIDPEIVRGPFHGQHAEYNAMQQPMQYVPQNAGPRQKQKRRDSGGAIDFGTENIAPQWDAEHAGRRQQYMGAPRHAPAGPPALDQNTVPTLVPGLHLNNPIDLTGAGITEQHVQASRHTAPSSGHNHYPYGQPVGYPQAQQQIETAPDGYFTGPYAPWLAMSTYANPHYTHAQRADAQGPAYLQSAQPFLQYTQMQQHQQTRQKSESRDGTKDRNGGANDRQ